MVDVCKLYAINMSMVLCSCATGSLISRISVKSFLQFQLPAVALGSFKTVSIEADVVMKVTRCNATQRDRLSLLWKVLLMLIKYNLQSRYILLYIYVCVLCIGLSMLKTLTLPLLWKDVPHYFQLREMVTILHSFNQQVSDWLNWFNDKQVAITILSVDSFARKRTLLISNSLIIRRSTPDNYILWLTFLYIYLVNACFKTDGELYSTFYLNELKDE